MLPPIGSPGGSRGGEEGPRAPPSTAAPRVAAHVPLFARRQVRKSARGLDARLSALLTTAAAASPGPAGPPALQQLGWQRHRLELRGLGDTCIGHHRPWCWRERAASLQPYTKHGATGSRSQGLCVREQLPQKGRRASHRQGPDRHPAQAGTPCGGEIPCVSIRPFTTSCIPCLCCSSPAPQLASSVAPKLATGDAIDDDLVVTSTGTSRQ